MRFEITPYVKSVGIGAIFSPKDKPIAHFSRKLKPAEHNYDAHRKEALAVVEL